MKKLFLILLLSLGLTAASYAESVNVKYQGRISLDGFYCEYTSSSFVDRICYYQPNKYVVVSLSGNYYQYCGVPYSTVNNWLNSYSKGRFYNSYIKGRFDCRYSNSSNNPCLERGKGGVCLAAKGGERMRQGVKQMLGISNQSQNTGNSEACKNGSGDLWEIICKD
jgi:hypothetical protein